MFSRINKNLILIVIFAFAIFANSCENKESRINGEIEPFDETVAFQTIKKLVEIGQRHSGSDGALKTVLFIEKELSENAIPFFRYEWEEDTPFGKITFRNIVAQIKISDNAPWVIIGSHYDTKKLELCPGFQGANDSASGIAIMIEIAKSLIKKKEKLKKNIEFVFFDGEECAYEYGEKDGLHGSKKHLQIIKEQNRKIDAVIIPDMLADKDLDAFIPPESDNKLAKIFLETAEELGYGNYFSRKDINMIDDHKPFVEAKIPSILIIDFNYGPNNIYWHSSGDNLNNISPKSLAISGKTIFVFIKKLGSR